MIKTNSKQIHNIVKEYSKLLSNQTESYNFLMDVTNFLSNNLYFSDEIILSQNPDFKTFSKKQKELYIERNFAFNFGLFIHGENIPPFKMEQIYQTFFCNKLKFLKSEDFNNNPYIRDIKFDEPISIGNITLTKADYLQREIQMFNQPIKNKDFSEHIEFCVYDDKIEFPILKENGETWMSVVKSEMSTQDPHIKKLKGNVLIFGLGLGYSTYMTLLKDDVTSVTVVEKNPIIIDIFNKYILPQFKINKKLTIIEDNAMEYFLEKENMNKFDSCFIDIWMNVYTGLDQYCFFKENEDNIKYEIEYWLDYTFKSAVKNELILGFLNKSSFPLLNLKINEYLSTHGDIKINNGEELHSKLFNSNLINKILKTKL